MSQQTEREGCPLAEAKAVAGPETPEQKHNHAKRLALIHGKLND